MEHLDGLPLSSLKNNRAANWAEEHDSNSSAQLPSLTESQGNGSQRIFSYPPSDLLMEPYGSGHSGGRPFDKSLKGDGADH